MNDQIRTSQGDPSTTAGQPEVSATVEAGAIRDNVPNPGSHVSEQLQARSTEGMAIEGGEAGQKPVSPTADEILSNVFCPGYFCRQSTCCARHRNRSGEAAALWLRRDMDSECCAHFKVSA